MFQLHNIQYSTYSQFKSICINKCQEKFSGKKLVWLNNRITAFHTVNILHAIGLFAIGHCLDDWDC